VKKFFDLLLIGLVLLLVLALAPAMPTLAQGTAPAEVGFFTDYEVAPGDLVEVPIQIRAVTDLYAMDISLTFDPAVVTVEDGNSNRPGVQPALGTFLEAGMTLFNTVDVEAGEVHFAMSQVNPSEPKSGDGILLVLYVRGVAEGETALTITNLEMSDRFGDAIVGTPLSGRVTVSGEAVQSDATAIPVQDATRMVAVPTLAPTATSEVTATPTRVDPTPTEQVSQVSAAAPSITLEIVENRVEENQDGGSSILAYWWVVLAAGAVAGFGFYLLRSRA
jgi:cell division septation protein DedD